MSNNPTYIVTETNLQGSGQRTKTYNTPLIIACVVAWEKRHWIKTSIVVSDDAGNVLATKVSSNPRWTYTPLGLDELWARNRT